MSITHHPPEDLLADYAAGALEEAEHLILAVHVAGCARCSRFTHAIEQLGGVALDETEPAPMPSRSFDVVMSRIGEPPRVEARSRVTEVSVPEYEELPKLLRRCRYGKRRRIAPGVRLQPIELSGAGKARAFLLQSSPGTRMLEHTHSGTELTCVLKGSFRHQGGRYGPGDFDYGDENVDHRPVVGNEGPCLCLVVMTGELRLNGFFGRLISPFIRL